MARLKKTTVARRMNSATKTIEKVALKAPLRAPRIAKVTLGKKTEPRKTKAKMTGKIKVVMRKKALAPVDVTRYMAVVSGGEKPVELGPFLSKRAALVDAKRLMLRVAQASGLPRGQRVRTVRAGTMQLTKHYPKVMGNDFDRPSYSKGTFSRWRVSGDDGYVIGEGSTRREAVILVQAKATIRLNGKRRKTSSKRRK